MALRWPWRKPEVRSANYTDQVIAQIMASASGASDGGALAVIEASARWWGSGLASATVKPDNVALRSVSPTILDSIGRALCRSGQSLHAIAVRNGRVTLTPVSLWEVHGDDAPASWTYRCSVSGPDVTRLVTLPAASVLHVRYSPHPSRPWAGRSPVALAMDTARAAALLETATAGELNFTQQQVLTPRRNQSDYGLADALPPETIQKIVAAFAEHVHTGAFVIPADVQAQRLGPEPPDSFPLLRRELENALYAAHGIPPSLINSQANGVSMREGFRQVFHGLLKPLGAIIAEELRAKLDPAAALDFSELRAGDITGTSRALGSLVAAGITPQAAAAIVGLDDVEVSA